MKYYITLVFLILISFQGFGKGCSGNYYISGTIYSKGNTVIKNTSINIIIGEKHQVVDVDSLGHFEIEIFWTNSCPSGRNWIQHKFDNRKNNPKHVIIKYQDQEIVLENKWEKFAECSPVEKEEITWKKDIYFNI